MSGARGPESAWFLFYPLYHPDRGNAHVIVFVEFAAFANTERGAAALTAFSGALIGLKPGAVWVIDIQLSFHDRNNGTLRFGRAANSVDGEYFRIKHRLDVESAQLIQRVGVNTWNL